MTAHLGGEVGGKHRAVGAPGWDCVGLKQMNGAMLGGFVVAVLVSQMEVFHRLPGTVDISLRQFGWPLVPAAALLVSWQIGRIMARRGAQQVPA